LLIRFAYRDKGHGLCAVFRAAALLLHAGVCASCQDNQAGTAWSL
jgi:hypothetical protein